MPNQTGPKRTEGQRAVDIIEESRLYCEGRSFAEIATWVGEHRPYTISTAQAYNDIAAARRAWEAKAAESIGQRRAEEMAKIDRLEQTYWEAWYKSLSEKQIRTVSTDLEPSAKKTDDEDGPVERTTKMARMMRIEQSWGDPRFLTGIQWCIERRCKLLGLDMPQRVDATITLKQMAKELAEAEGLDPDEVLIEAQRIFDTTRGF